MNTGFEVVGIGRAAGEFEGRKYDNTYIHVTYQSDKITGVGCKTIKVKSSIFDRNPVCPGEIIDINCDQFGQVKEIVRL